MSLLVQSSDRRGCGPSGLAPPSSHRYKEITCVASVAFPPALERSTQKREWKKIAFFFFNPVVTPILVVVALVGLVFGAVIGTTRRLYELCDPKSRALAQSVAQMQADVLRAQLYTLRKVSSIYAQEISIPKSTYSKELNTLIALIRSPVKKEKEPERMHQVRRQLRRLLQTEEYKAHWKTDRVDVVYLQLLAQGLKTGARSGRSLENVGRYLQENYGDNTVIGKPLSVRQFSKNVEQMYQKMPALHRTHWFWKIVWWCAHPLKSIHAVKAEGFLRFLGFHPEIYNSYEHGNLEQCVGYFKYAHSRRAFFLGPGLGQDREIDCAFLEAQRKQGVTHWQHSLENSDNPGEITRLDAQSRISDHFPDTLVFHSSQLDGPCELGFGIREDAPLFVRKYYTQLEKHLERQEGAAPFHDKPRVAPKDNGFTFDRRYLSVGDVKGALRAAYKIMNSSLRGCAHWRALSARRKARTLLLTFEVLAKLKALLNMMQIQTAPAQGSLPAMHTSAEACKQDIDRGIVLNVLTQICIALLHGETISSELSELLTGMTFARALMVDGRAPIEHRLEGIPDFLKLISRTPAVQHHFITSLREFLGEASDQLTFHISR